MMLADRLLLVAILVFGVASTATLYSLNSRIEALESRLAAPEVTSAISTQQGKAAIEQLAALTRPPSGAPKPVIASAAPAPPAPPSLAAAPSPPAPASPARRPLGSVEDMIDALDARLKKNPGDAEGWRMLGWSYFRTGHYDEAALAYAKAIQARPGVAAYRSARGEALIKAAGGVVTDEAKELFGDALRLDPKDPTARLFDGLIKAQAGDKTAALDEWVSLANELGTESPIVPELMQRISELSREVGVDVTPRLQQPGPATAAAGSSGATSTPQERTTPEE